MAVFRAPLGLPWKGRGSNNRGPTRKKLGWFCPTLKKPQFRFFWWHGWHIMIEHVGTLRMISFHRHFTGGDVNFLSIQRPSSCYFGPWSWQKPRCPGWSWLKLSQDVENPGEFGSSWFFERKSRVEDGKPSVYQILPGIIAGFAIIFWVSSCLLAEASFADGRCGFSTCWIWTAQTWQRLDDKTGQWTYGFGTWMFRGETY